MREALPPNLRDLARLCHPRRSDSRTAGAVIPPRTWSGPGVSAQPCRALLLLCYKLGLVNDLAVAAIS